MEPYRQQTQLQSANRCHVLVIVLVVPVYPAEALEQEHSNAARVVRRDDRSNYLRTEAGCIFHGGIHYNLDQRKLTCFGPFGCLDGHSLLRSHEGHISM